MARNTSEWYRRISTAVEKLEILTRLAPMTDNDKEQAFVSSVLLAICHDYAVALRAALDEIPPCEGAEEVEA